MEQNLNPSSNTNPQASVPVPETAAAPVNQAPVPPVQPAAPQVVPPPPNSHHTSTKTTIFLLLILLGVTVIFSGVILSNKVSQDKLESEESYFPKRPVNSVKLLPTVNPTSTPINQSPMTQEQKDLQDLDVSSVEADIQNIKTDLQGL